MKRVTGIGGIFFKAKDPVKLREWYRQHLGIEAESWGFAFNGRDDPGGDSGRTTWAPFPDDTKYFDQVTKPFMINFRVADLDRLLTELRAEGVEVEAKAEESEFGKFSWVMDPEGNRLEAVGTAAPPVIRWTQSLLRNSAGRRSARAGWARIQTVTFPFGDGTVIKSCLKHLLSAGVR